MDACNIQLCRICITSHTSATQMISIFGEDLLWQKITTLADVKIEKGDTLPQQVCVPCAKNAIAACLFKKKCEDADNFFRQQLLIQKIENKLSQGKGSNYVNLNFENNYVVLSETEDNLSEEIKQKTEQNAIKKQQTTTEKSDNENYDQQQALSGDFKTNHHRQDDDEDDGRVDESNDLNNSIMNMNGMLSLDENDMKNFNPKAPFDLNSLRLMQQYMMQQQFGRMNGTRMENGDGHSRGGSMSDGDGGEDEHLPLIPEIELITPSEDATSNGVNGMIPTTPLRGYQCPTCFQIFEMKQILKAHMQSVHGTSGPVYECNNCKKTYFYKRFLEKHIRRGRCVKKRRNQTRPMQCSDCHVIFPTGHHLGWHKRTGCPSKAAKMPLQQLLRQNIVQYNNFPKRIGMRKPENALYLQNRKILALTNKRKGRTRIKLDAKKIALAKQLILREATTTVIANELQISRTFAWRLRKSLVNGVSLHERVVDQNGEEAIELPTDAELNAQEQYQQQLLQQQQQNVQDQQEQVSDDHQESSNKEINPEDVDIKEEKPDTDEEDDEQEDDDDDDDEDDDDSSDDSSSDESQNENNDQSTTNEQRDRQNLRQQQATSSPDSDNDNEEDADNESDRQDQNGSNNNDDSDEDDDDNSESMKSSSHHENQLQQDDLDQQHRQQFSQQFPHLANASSQKASLNDVAQHLDLQKLANNLNAQNALPLLSQFPPAVAAALHQLPVNLSIRPITSLQDHDKSSTTTKSKKPRKPNVFIDDEKYAMAKVLVAQDASTMEIARALNVSQMTAWKVRDAIVKGLPLSYRNKRDVARGPSATRGENSTIVSPSGGNSVASLSGNLEAQQFKEQHLQQLPQQNQLQDLQEQQKLNQLKQQQHLLEHQQQQLDLKKQQQIEQLQQQQLQILQRQQLKQQQQMDIDQASGSGNFTGNSNSNGPVNGVNPRKRLKAYEREVRDKEITKEILDMIREDSNIQYWKVSAKLAEKGYAVSPSSVCQKLKSMGIHRRWKPGDKPPLLDMDHLKAVTANITNGMTSSNNVSSADESCETQHFEMGGAHFLSAFSR